MGDDSQLSRQALLFEEIANSPAMDGSCMRSIDSNSPHHVWRGNRCVINITGIRMCVTSAFDLSQWLCRDPLASHVSAIYG